MYKYINIHYVTLIYPLLITSEFQVKLLFVQKTVVVTIFRPLYINLKPILCMKSNNTLFVDFSTS